MSEITVELTVEEQKERVGTGDSWPAFDVFGGAYDRRGAITRRNLGNNRFVVIPAGRARHIVDIKLASATSKTTAKAAKDSE